MRNLAISDTETLGPIPLPAGVDHVVVHCGIDYADDGANGGPAAHINVGIDDLALTICPR